MLEIRWNYLTAPEISDLAKRDAVVLVPIGSTEQHGPHLPTGVDDFLVTEVCERAAIEFSKTQPIVVTPTVWCAIANHHQAFGGTFTLSLSTFASLLQDICDSLAVAGFSKVVLVNGHGGNISALNAIANEISRRSSLRLATSTYFMECDEKITEILDDQKGLMHACEGETSMMMAWRPDLVRVDRLSIAVGPSFDILRSLKPDLRSYQSFIEVTKSGVCGDARRSSAEKGNKIFDACASRLAKRLIDGEPWY